MQYWPHPLYIIKQCTSKGIKEGVLTLRLCWGPLEMEFDSSKRQMETINTSHRHRTKIRKSLQEKWDRVNEHRSNTWSVVRKERGQYCNHMSQEVVSWQCHIRTKFRWRHHHQYVWDKGILRKEMLETKSLRWEYPECIQGGNWVAYDWPTEWGSR